LRISKSAKQQQRRLVEDFQYFSSFTVDADLTVAGTGHGATICIGIGGFVALHALRRLRRCLSGVGDFVQ